MIQTLKRNSSYTLGSGRGSEEQGDGVKRQEEEEEEKGTEREVQEVGNRP